MNTTTEIPKEFDLVPEWEQRLFWCFGVLGFLDLERMREEGGLKRPEPEGFPGHTPPTSEELYSFLEMFAGCMCRMGASRGAFRALCVAADRETWGAEAGENADKNEESQ